MCESCIHTLLCRSGDKVQVASGSTPSQQQRTANSVQGRSSSASSTKTLQATGLLQAQGTPICPSPGLTQVAHFKPGTLNITKGGKITMQPMSVTIPLVNTVGLGPLPPSQQQNAHPQPALLVTTTSADSSGGGGKTEIHIQPQMSSASSGAVS